MSPHRRPPRPLPRPKPPTPSGNIRVQLHPSKTNSLSRSADPRRPTGPASLRSTDPLHSTDASHTARSRLPSYRSCGGRRRSPRRRHGGGGGIRGSSASTATMISSPRSNGRALIKTLGGSHAAYSPLHSRARARPGTTGARSTVPHSQPRQRPKRSLPEMTACAISMTGRSTTAAYPRNRASASSEPTASCTMIIPTAWCTSARSSQPAR